MTRALTILVVFCFVVHKLFSQIGINEWRAHLPYSKATFVTETKDKIFCSTSSALFSYHKLHHTIETITKISGLSDVNISVIKYSRENNLLLVGYHDGNIDLILDNRIYNLSDIKRKQISGNKTINNILFVGQYAYLSCSFGIVVLNLMKKEIKDTYFIGKDGSSLTVYEVAFDGTNLFAATESGLLIANYDNPFLVDYSNWSKVTQIPGWNKKFNAITYLNGQVFANLTNTTNNIDSVFIRDANTWSFFTHSGYENLALSAAGNKLLVISRKNIKIFTSDGEFEREINTYSWADSNPNYAIFDSDNTLWIADQIYGLVKTTDFTQYDSMVPNGPYNRDVYSISIKNSVLWVAGGGLTNTWGNLWKAGEIYSFKKGQWKSNLIYSVMDIINILVDPANPDHIFAASWNYGVIELNNNEITNIFNQTNSSLQAFISGPNDVKTYGLLLDRQNNLWVTNSGVNRPVSVKTSDNEWKSFYFNGLISGISLGKIVETETGIKWIYIPKGGGLFAFDINNSILNESDDQFSKFDIKDENAKIISNNVFSIANDLEGNIWVGTNEGPVIYYNPENVFSGQNFFAHRIKIPREDGSGLADYMLGTETITAITVDGANRKWIGTENAGVFLLSPDGTKQIYSFNENNSPLLSNNITSIAIDHQSGEVFFGTDKGIISYRSTATQASNEFNKVFVFPNPVREDYDGPITITGLVSDAEVKITDISGNIVYETRALGGQVIWDGRNFSGARVQTGVYLIFCTNEDGSKTHVTKLLFIH